MTLWWYLAKPILSMTEYINFPCYNDWDSHVEEENVILSQPQAFLYYKQWMGFLKWHPKRKNKCERKHLRSSDNKLDIYYFQLGIYINIHTWDQRSQFYSALCGETNHPSHSSNATHTSGCVDGQGAGKRMRCSMRLT